MAAVTGTDARYGRVKKTGLNLVERTVLSVPDNPWQIERRGDGTLIVRMRSRDRGQGTLPDAVFSFRAGDPQYELWDQRMRETERRAG